MIDLKARVEAAVMARGGKKQGAEIRFKCPSPSHDDTHNSADYNPTKHVWICRACGESGNYWHLGVLLGVINNGDCGDGFRETRRWDIGGVAIHKRLDRDGAKKIVKWERQGKAGLHGLQTADLPLYAAELLTDADADVLLSEGEKPADALLALGFAAVGTVTGAGGTPSTESLKPLAERRGRIFLCRDNDQPGHQHMTRIAARLLRMGKRAHLIDWPDVPDKGDAYDYIAAGHTADDVRAALDAAPLYAGEAEPEPEQNSYILTDDKGKQTLDIEGLINDLLVDFHFVTLRDNDEILIYQDGYYQPQGRRFIKAECQWCVGVSSLLTEHKVNEITGHIIRSTYVDRRAFNTNKFALNLLNGLLDTRSRELRPHTPDHFSTIRIPVTYDANADCPAIRKFFSEVHHSEDIPVVGEIIGYCLTPDNSFQKAILNVGGGDQGKSTELSLLKAFLGADNVSNVPWHALELNRFAMSALEGKLANIFADLPSHSLNITSAFKMLTGGDTIGTEKKFGDYFSFVNHAKLIFSTNKPPKVLDEDSYAFWRRWIILDFPNQIPEDKKDVNILDKLTTPAELSGLLNIALDGLARLRAAGRFSYDRSVEDTTEYYLRAADPVYAFLQDCVEVSPKDWVTKDDLYVAFEAYCATQRLPVSKPNSFARSLQNQAGYRISSTRPEVDGKRVTAWQGIKISVKDVKVFSLSKGHARGNNNTQMGIKIEKNAGNLDAIASITHDHQNPDAKPQNPDADDLPGYPSCEFTPTEDWQEVPPDADVPPGLEIRMDLTSGNNFARKLPPKVDYAAALGMPVKDAIEIWRSEGAPVIHLGPGVNCFDVESLLTRPDVSSEHLEAVKTWLHERKGGE